MSTFLQEQGEHESRLHGIDRESQGPGLGIDGRDLVTPASSILKRKRGQATLTIFVKPENGGKSEVMLTEGLSW